jgi:hypothetical protein
LAGADEVITTTGGPDLTDDDLTATRYWHAADRGGAEPDLDTDIDDWDYEDSDEDDVQDERGRS